mmetsp:Transcript_28326/g.80875  ORF Transcript_28326/g.80875 Transcript_28326/m.80875 type:complete len:621 (-) Transcript_28326:418-2280(-)
MLVLLVFLDCSDALLCLRVEIVDELRQHLGQSVRVRLAEFIENLAVTLILEHRLKDLDHWQPQVVFVPVGQIVVAHDSLLHADEHVQEARDELLREGRPVPQLLPGREREAELVHEFNRLPPKRRVLHVAVRGHHEAKQREHGLGLDEGEKARGYAPLPLSGAVQVAQVDDIFQHGTWQGVPGRPRLGRRQRHPATAACLNQEAEGQVDEVAQPRQELRLLQRRVAQQVLAQRNVRLRWVGGIHARGDVLEGLERLLGHREKQAPQPLGSQPENLRFEQLLVICMGRKTRIVLCHAHRRLDLLLLAEARLLQERAQHLWHIRAEWEEWGKRVGMLPLDRLDQVKQKRKGVECNPAGREPLNPGVHRLEQQEVFQRSEKLRVLVVRHHVEGVVPELRPKIAPLRQHHALLPAGLGGRQQQTQPVHHRHPGRVAGADEHVDHLRGLGLGGRELDLRPALQLVEALPGGPLQVRPLRRAGLGGVSLRRGQQSRVEGGGGEGPAEQGVALQAHAPALLVHHLPFLVLPHELRLERGPPNLVQARRRHEGGRVLAGRAEHAHQLAELLRSRIVEVAALQGLGHLHDHPSRDVVVLGGSRKKLVHELRWDGLLEKRRECAHLILGR